MGKGFDNSDPQKSSDLAIKVVGGNMRGAEMLVPSENFTVGRMRSADLQLDDPMLSREHCRIFYGVDGWYIQDLESTNGTWVGGQRIDGRVRLPLNTSIRIGTSVLQLRCINPLEDTKSLKDAEIFFSLQPDTLTAKTGSVGNFSAMEVISAIYRFQNCISSTLDKHELFERILDAVSEVITSGNVYILTFDLNRGRFIPRLQFQLTDRAYKRDCLGELNSTVINFVKENHEAVLSKVKSHRMGNHADSVMCVPMIGKDQVNGMLYMEQDAAKYTYTENDLRLMAVIARSAGMAIEFADMLKFNLRNERLVATGTTAASLSHYIKNILAGLDGSMGLLEMGIRDRDMKLAGSSLSIVRRNHDRLGNLVMDLLNLASDRKPNRELVDLRTILKDIHELMACQLGQQGIKLIFEPQLPDYPVYAEVDVKGIHRTLLNLVNNAQHAVSLKKTGREDGFLGKISLSADLEKERDFAKVTVADNGVGVASAEKDKIFDLFISSKGSAGTGLGLAVCRKIIEAHGGSIAVEGKSGKGCIISFAVPISLNSQDTTAMALPRVNLDNNER
ncbi:FHA domain-containing protein [Lentisphaerota bacterium ZTH]|nr:FHA domain-containing protein [Lentisphaerota bacterium]WET05407.1 FHA domain-containing protein [Lentisphaerota bacterium ZTH]